MSPPATTSEASSAPGSDGLNRIGGRSAVLVGSGPAGRRGHWGERAAHARELRDRAHLRRRQALSPLDFRAHAVTEYDNHPIGVLIAHCGHLLPMVVEIDATPPGRPCPACTLAINPAPPTSGAAPDDPGSAGGT